jgi:ArsR family transcriptional regulator, arsenate/arsenite/antimonite-responsive transcriptional repressor
MTQKVISKQARQRGPACCPGGIGKPINRKSAEALAELLKAVADPTRLQLISLIRDSDQCTACVGDLTEAVGLSQPTVSHHLRVLVDAGILSKEKDGYWTWYTLNMDRLGELAAVLS